MSNPSIVNPTAVTAYGFKCDCSRMLISAHYNLSASQHSLYINDTLSVIPLEYYLKTYHLIAVTMCHASMRVTTFNPTFDGPTDGNF